MGLITRADGKYAILTDILGDEDHLGDMDFKVLEPAMVFAVFRWISKWMD